MDLLAVPPVRLCHLDRHRLAEIYPFPNTDEDPWCARWSRSLAGVLVIKESSSCLAWPPHPPVARGTLGVLAVLALGCYYHFGSDQFMDVAKGRLTIVHTWDMRNYFPTAKYFKELRFDGMYLASLAAYVDIVGKGDPASVKDAQPARPDRLPHDERGGSRARSCREFARASPRSAGKSSRKT